MWKSDSLEELIQQVENCDKKLTTGISKKKEEQAYAVFSRLVLQHTIREAACFITDRAENGGILQPDNDADEENQ